MESNMCEGSFELIKDTICKFAPCMDDYLYIYDIKEDMYYISEKALERFCIPSNYFTDVINMHKLFVYADDLPMLIEDLTKMAGGEKQQHNLVYRWLGHDGMPIWINCCGKLINDELGKPAFMIGCINEIGTRQKADNVSGLLGEVAFQMQIGAFMDGFPKGFILRLGIDDFKDINEKFGTTYGDFVLRGIAECIENCIEQGQQAYRMQSDEFLVFDFLGGDTDKARRLYHTIRTEVDNFVEKQHYEAVYTISGGIITNEHMKDNDYNEIMKISQFALSEAKRRGKNQVYIFDNEDYQKFLRKRVILRAIRQSIANDFEGFNLYFQPIVDVSNGKLFAAESLLRFNISETEAISPAEFIPLLEESGLIIPVGKWILRNAFAMCQECQKVYPDFKISINLSYIQILKSPIIDEIMANIDDFVLHPSGIIVELTESGYIENTPAVQSVWGKLKNKGVNIAIDDFGTGYSNLQSIGNMMPNIVKLDRSFTVKSLKNIYERQLMIHIIQMVHSIGLRICVEGIETVEELQKIAALGPDYIQGYYYSKPCPKEEFLNKFIKG